MSGRYGRYIAALGGLALASAALAQQSPHSSKNDPKHAKDAQTNSAQSPPSVYEAQSLSAARDANAIAREANRIAAEQAGIGYLQLIIGVGGVGLTALAAGAAIAAAIYAKKAADHTERGATEAKRSADAAHEALEDARKDTIAQNKRYAQQARETMRSGDAMEVSARGSAEAARAAKRTTQIMEDTARRQLQAYVNVTSATIGWADQGAEAVVTIVNCGATPATYFELVWLMDFQKIGGPSPAPVESDQPGVTWSALGAGGQTTAPLRWSGIKQSDLDPAGTNYLSVRGFVRYGTIYNETFETEFSFMLRHRLGKNADKMQHAAGRLRVYRQVQGEDRP